MNNENLLLEAFSTIEILLKEIIKYFEIWNILDFDAKILEIKLEINKTENSIHSRINFHLESLITPIFPKNDIINLHIKEDNIYINSIIYSDYGISDIISISKKINDFDNKDILSLKPRIINELKEHLHFIKTIL